MSEPGLVHHIGEQREIFKTGRAEAKISLADLSSLADLYALGPVGGLDGEITVFDSQPYVSQIRGEASACVVDRTFNHDAIFLVWTQVREWTQQRIPESVLSYRELETFVNQAALQQGIVIDAPFPFLMSGKPQHVAWHINVDRTGGQPITRELFRRSKQPYTLCGENMDIFGVWSDRHGGVFMGDDMKIHIQVETSLHLPTLFRYLVALLFFSTLVGVALAAASRPIALAACRT